MAGASSERLSNRLRNRARLKARLRLAHALLPAVVMRATIALLVLATVSCAEAKKQAKLGLFGGGTRSGPANPQMPNMMPAHPDPVSAVGAAVGASVASRALGGCVAYCPAGTVCNEKTGLCDTLPCRGQCKQDETCENERCVPALLPNLRINQKQ